MPIKSVLKTVKKAMAVMLAPMNQLARTMTQSSGRVTAMMPSPRYPARRSGTREKEVKLLMARLKSFLTE